MGVLQGYSMPIWWIICLIEADYMGVVGGYIPPPPYTICRIVIYIIPLLVVLDRGAHRIIYTSILYYIHIGCPYNMPT